MHLFDPALFPLSLSPFTLSSLLSRAGEGPFWAGANTVRRREMPFPDSDGDEQPAVYKNKRLAAFNLPKGIEEWQVALIGNGIFIFNDNVKPISLFRLQLFERLEIDIAPDIAEALVKIGHSHPIRP